MSLLVCCKFRICPFDCSKVGEFWAINWWDQLNASMRLATHWKYFLMLTVVVHPGWMCYINMNLRTQLVMLVKSSPVLDMVEFAPIALSVVKFLLKGRLLYVY